MSNMNIKAIIKQLSAEYFQEVTEIRRALHSCPELGFEEYQTAEFIQSKLDEYGISYKKGVARTGIVAVIEGKSPEGKTVALRADMDALPISEANDVPYKSKNQGVMHACGHDAHMASLLGVAKILVKLKENFTGKVMLIFQPSEEKFPGGAIAMIQEGILQDPRPDYMLGMHVYPVMETGKIGLLPGKNMASTDEIYMTVTGRGGHAATPELNVDPVLITSHIIVALQQIVSRMAKPTMPTVLSFGRVIANGKTNVIPDQVQIEGTFRTFDEEWREKAHVKISEIALSLAEAMGGSCKVDIVKGYPFLVNDEWLTTKVREFAEEYLGAKNVEEIDMRLTAEDFAYYSQLIPACFYRLGVKEPGASEVANLHTNQFHFDERSLQPAMGVMAWVTINLLGCD